VMLAAIIASINYRVFRVLLKGTLNRVFSRPALTLIASGDDLCAILRAGDKCTVH
jgi:hypothetical protein